MSNRSRSEQLAFRESVIKLQKLRRHSLYCVICPLLNKVGCDKNGNDLKLEAHHTDPYFQSLSHDPEFGTLVCKQSHILLHNSDGTLTYFGKRLLLVWHKNYTKDFADAGLLKCPNKDIICE